MTSKIAIITCWQGNFPAYFPLWVKSCESNPNVDWLLFADREPDMALPKNVIFYPMTMGDMQQRVQEQLKLAGKGLTSPYKLCDFRPAYGWLFEKELTGYTHWGHCDIDLVWGCFEDFLTDELLNAYDKIYTKGHLSIYRNAKEVNERIWDKSSVYPFEVVSETPNFYAYDELTGIERVYRKRGYAYYNEAPYVDVSVRCESSFLFNVTEKNREKQAFYWEDGKVYRVYADEKGAIITDEWLYIHFQKKSPANYIENAQAVKAFWLGPNGFVEKKESVVTIEDIERYNPSISEQQIKKENKAYVKKKLKHFFAKSCRDKRIHLKQRISRIFF